MSDNLRFRILNLTKKYYKTSFNNKLNPKKDYVPTSGKVFDETELMNLVGSSLDFWLTEGRYNLMFERELSRFSDLKYVATVNSGSSANLLAFYALTSPQLGIRAIRKGDEIIEVATCFPTTLSPVVQFGCFPVFVDSSIPFYNPLARDVLKAVTPKTKAIFLAHTLGNPFEVEEIASYCKKNNIWLIEDCCDALGAEYKGKKVGTFGDISTLSFYPAHQITCGEGGAVMTNDAGLSKIVRSFRDWGRDCWCAPGKENTCGIRFDWQLGKLPKGYDHKYIYSHLGFNLKMTDMQASIGLAQIKKIKKFIKKRRENHELLSTRLAKFEKFFILPKATEKSIPSWFGFVLTIRDKMPFTRLELVQYLEKNRIGTRLLFGGNITRQPAMENVSYRIHGKLKNSDKIMNDTFWIGCYPAINSQTIGYVVKVFDNFFKMKGLP